MTKLSVLFMSASVALFSTSAFAVNSFNIWQGSDGNNYCYASDAHGDTPNGAQPTDPVCCTSGSVDFFNWAQGADGNTYCYASDMRGNVPNGSSATNNVCCQ